jgi:chromate transporter
MQQQGKASVKMSPRPPRPWRLDFYTQKYQQMEKSTFPRRPSFNEALRFWFKLGWISFGGTAGHIAIMHDYLVDRRKWISNSRFFHALSLCMLLPGPEAQQLAIYIGWKLHGKKGGVAAGTLFVLPSMLILLGLSILYVEFGNLPLIAALFSGLKPAVVALIIVSVVKVSRKAITGPLQVVVAATAFIVIFLFNISLLIIIGASILLALAIRTLKPSLLAQNAGEVAAEQGEDPLSEIPEPPFSTGRLFRQVLVFALLWAAPLVLLYIFAPVFSFWQTLVLFWTQTAIFTIGGSYTVLPYVAQFAVGKLHWLSKLQMIDGFALAETTPGPLIIVVTFVGFLAGYHQFNASIGLATIALLLTTYYTFLPCFFYIFVGGPVIERTHGNTVLANILHLITASIVGMIVNLALYLGKDVIFPSGNSLRHPDPYALAWVLLSLLLILRFRIKVLYLIAASVCYGLVRHVLTL